MSARASSRCPSAFAAALLGGPTVMLGWLTALGGRVEPPSAIVELAVWLCPMAIGLLVVARLIPGHSLANVFAPRQWRWLLTAAAVVVPVGLIASAYLDSFAIGGFPSAPPGWECFDGEYDLRSWSPIGIHPLEGWYGMPPDVYLLECCIGDFSLLFGCQPDAATHWSRWWDIAHFLIIIHLLLVTSVAVACRWRNAAGTPQ